MQSFIAVASTMKKSLCLTLLVAFVVLHQSTSHAQLTAQQLLNSMVTDYGPQYKDIDTAVALFREGKLDEARKSLAAGKQKNPQLAPVDVMFAHLLFNSSAAAQAPAIVEKVVVDEPADPESYIMLADLALRQRRLAEAELLFEKGLAVCNEYSNNAYRRKKLTTSALAGRAAVAEARADWNEADKRLTAWIEVDAKNTNALSRRANVRFQLDQIAAAAQDFSAARKIDDNLPRPEVRLALLYDQQGEAKKTEEGFAAAIKAAPRDLATRLAVARWAIENGKQELAAESIKVAQDIDADSLEVQLATGIAARYAGDHKTAVEAFEAALKQSPRNFTAINSLALTLIDSTDEQERVRAFGYAQLNRHTHVDNASRSGREASVTTAWTLFRLGHADQAARMLQSILNAGPIGSESAYYAAVILLDRGNAETAAKILVGALRNKSPFPGRAAAERVLAHLIQLGNEKKSGQ